MMLFLAGALSGCGLALIVRRYRWLRTGYRNGWNDARQVLIGEIRARKVAP